jgi:hypothetical protein
MIKSTVLSSEQQYGQMKIYNDNNNDNWKRPKHVVCITIRNACLMGMILIK